MAAPMFQAPAGSPVAQEFGDCLDVGMNVGYLRRSTLERGHSVQTRMNFLESLKIVHKIEDRLGQELILAQVALVDSQSEHVL